MHKVKQTSDYDYTSRVEQFWH